MIRRYITGKLRSLTCDPTCMKTAVNSYLYTYFKCQGFKTPTHYHGFTCNSDVTVRAFHALGVVPQWQKIRVITKLPNSEQSYKGKVKTHKYINRQNQSTTGKLCKP